MSCVDKDFFHIDNLIMPQNRRLFLIITLLTLMTLSACSGFSTVALFPENPDEIVEWLFMTPLEQMSYMTLKTTREREAFIEEFWQKRNPNPLSPVNEFREEIERRVAFCNQWFGEMSRNDDRGWDSERGRIYILLGPPDLRNRQDRMDFQQPGFRDTALREQWIYDRYDLVLIFRESSLFGEFRLEMIPPRLYQIIDEIRHNSLSPDGGFEVPLSLEASFEKDRIRISIPVSDLYFVEEESCLHAELALTVHHYDALSDAEGFVFETKITASANRLLRESKLAVILKLIDLPVNLRKGRLRIQVQDRRSKRRGYVSVSVRGEDRD